MRRIAESLGPRLRSPKARPPAFHARIVYSSPPPPDQCELEEGLLTRLRVMWMIRVSDRTLRRMIDTLEFPRPDATLKRSHRWHRQTVLDWLAARGRPPKKGA